jgi:hypothetical protein
MARSTVHAAKEAATAVPSMASSPSPIGLADGSSVPTINQRRVARDQHEGPQLWHMSRRSTRLTTAPPAIPPPAPPPPSRTTSARGSRSRWSAHTRATPACGRSSRLALLMLPLMLQPARLRLLDTVATRACWRRRHSQGGSAGPCQMPIAFSASCLLRCDVGAAVLTVGPGPGLRASEPPERRCRLPGTRPRSGQTCRARRGRRSSCGQP